MTGLPCVPLAAHVLCGLGMIFGVTMLILGTLVQDRSRGCFLMIVGLITCGVANLTWYDAASITCTCT
jgi:hypothetical protein